MPSIVFLTVFLSSAAILGSSHNQETVPSRIMAWPTGVFGTVVDANFTPIPGVRVELESMDSDLIASIKTDDLGRYRFECILDGDYRLRFRTEGFMEAQAKIRYRYPGTVRFSQILNVREELKPIGEDPLIVGVFDQVTGAPVAGATVNIDEATGVTDKCGRTWSESTGRRIRIRVSASGYKPRERIVERKAGETHFVRLELEWEY